MQKNKRTGQTAKDIKNDPAFQELVEKILPLVKEVDRLKKLQKKLRQPTRRKTPQ